MNSFRWQTVCLSLGLAVLLASTAMAKAPARGDDSLDFHLAYAPADEMTTEETGVESVTYAEGSDYREVSDFFNIREANANVEQGEWEVEVEFEWFTGKGEGDDSFGVLPNIKYGFTDDMWLEVEVLAENLGDGANQGNGDLAILFFYQFLHEDGTLPALAAWIDSRIPTGDSSSGVDGALHFNLTKTIADNFRFNFEAYARTANGGPGDEDEGRRPFQWGMGPGLDYQIDDQTIVLVNYLNRSSEETGHPNQNILECGLARELFEGSHLKAAADVGLDGHEETPEFGVKLEWTYEWR